MDESGWGDGPHTGPSASGDPHDKEKDELSEEDEAMDEDDDDDEDDDESDDEEEEEDASEEGRQRARKKKGKRSRREKIAGKTMQANKGQASAHETICNLSLAVEGNSSTGVVLSKINCKVLKETYDPAHPTDELEEMAVVDFPDSPKGVYDPAHPTDESEEKQEIKETVNSVNQFGIDQIEKFDPAEVHSQMEMHIEKGDRSSDDDQFSLDNKGRQKVGAAYLSATEGMHDDKFERGRFGEVKCERPKGESIEVSSEKDSWMQNTLVGDKIKVGDDSSINYVDVGKSAPKSVEHAAERDAGKNTFYLEEDRDLDSSFDVLKGLVNDLPEGSQAGRSSLNASLDASLETIHDTLHNSENNGSALTVLEKEDEKAEEPENKDEIVDSAVVSETVKLLEDVAERSLEEMDAERVEDMQDNENKSEKFKQENEAECPHGSHDEESLEEMEVLDKSLLCKETKAENDKEKRYKDQKGNCNEHKIKSTSGHNFKADCSEELKKSKDEGDKESEFKDVQSKNKAEISAESTNSYESSEDPVQKKLQKDKGIVLEDSDDLVVSGSEAQYRGARFEQDGSGSYLEQNDDTPGEEDGEVEKTDEKDSSDKSKDEIYNIRSRYKERGEHDNSKEIRKNDTKDITDEDENEEGELPKDSIDSPDEEKVRDDEYTDYRIRGKVDLKENVRIQKEPKVRKSGNKNSARKGKHKKISDKGKKLKKNVEDEEGEDGELHEKTEPSVKFNVIKHKKSGKDVNKSQRKYRHYRRSNSTRDDFDFEEHEKLEIAERIVYEKNDSHSLKSKETKKKENKGSERHASSRKQDRIRGERDNFFQHGEEGEWDNGEIEEGEFVEKTDYYKEDYYSRGNDISIEDYFSKFKEKNYYSKEKEKLKEDSYIKGKEKVKEDYHLKGKQKVKADHSSKGTEREKRKKSHKKEKVEHPPKPQPPMPQPSKHQPPKPQPAKPPSAKHQLPPPSSKVENKEDSDDDVQIVYVELSPWAHIPKMVQPKSNKKTADSKQSRLMIKVSQNNEDRTVWKEKQKIREKESGRDHGRGDRDKERRRERGRDADRSQRHRNHSQNRGSRSKDRSHRSRSRDRSRRRRYERSRSRSTNHSSHDRSYKRQRHNRSRDLSLSRERDWTRDRWSRERERSLDRWSPDRYRQRLSRERLSGERSRERWSRGRSLERWSLERDASMGRLSRERDTSLDRYKSPEILFDRRDLYGEEMKSPSPIRLLKEAKPSKKKGKEKQKEKKVVPIIVENDTPVKVKRKKKIPKGEKKVLAKKRKVEVIESPELPELPPELSPEKEDEIEFAVEESMQEEDTEMNEKITTFIPEDPDFSEDDSNDRLVIATEPEPEESGPEENEEEISDDERINRIENMQFRDPREGKSAPLMTRSKDYDPAHPTVSPIFDEGPDEDEVETRQGRMEPRLGKHPLPASAGDTFTVKSFPPPPPPPLNTVVSQGAIATQVPMCGPPGHGLMGQAPPLLPIPTSGASGVPLPLGLNVHPPGLQPGLPGPPPPRPLMAPPFMNRPPPSHLPPISEPVSQVRWPVSAPPGIVGQFRSRMSGDIGPAPPGLYDDLPPETIPSMSLPVDPAHSVAISVPQTVASTILSQPILIPESHPQGPPHQPVHHLSPHESLPLSNHEDLQHPQPHNVQTKPPVSLSTVVTNVSGTSPHMAIPRPVPSGEVIPGIGQISNLLAPAQLAIFGASEGTGKRLEHRDALNETGLFKVPLPPSSLAKATDGATKPFDKVDTSEVVDMDISSPSEDELSIELPLSPKVRKSHSKSKEKRDSKRREKRDSKKGSVIERKEIKSKSNEHVVDVDSSSSLKESFAAVMDSIFLQDLEDSEKVTEGLKESKKLRSHHKHRHRRHKEKKEINPQEMAVSDTQNELIEQVDEPSSAVDLTNKEKYLRKLHLQERVVDELKLALKPHYASKNIDKEQYKDILRKAVPKVCKSKDVNPAKIRKLVDAYVEKYQKNKKREGKITFGKSPQEKLTPNGNRPLNLAL